jgi:hypothetical protein
MDPELLQSHQMDFFIPRVILEVHGPIHHLPDRYHLLASQQAITAHALQQLLGAVGFTYRLITVPRGRVRLLPYPILVMQYFCKVSQ